VATSAVEVGPRIAMLRHRLGLSQVAFARRVGISRNALILYERGGRMPKSAPLVRIAEAGGSSVDWLLNGQARRAGARNDPEFEPAVLALRAVWRDPTRRRVVVAVLAALGQR
jgi:transcriptional regulator with XRE-family HTH domain